VGFLFCSCVSRVSLFHVRGQDAALRQTLEPFERVVDEDPVLVLGGRTLAAAVLSVFGVGCRRDFEVDVGELVKVGRVVDGTDVDGYGRRSLADVLPVDEAEERRTFNIISNDFRSLDFF